MWLNARISVILRCMDITFAELGLNEQLLEGVAALGFTNPTPVQAQAIPVVLEGRDVVASAQTGTGKTGAFTLPVLQLVGKAAKGEVAPRALIITPTRELAQQIDTVADKLCSVTGQCVATVIGGERYDRQLKRLKAGCDVLVATPGRLIDLMERKEVDLSHVQILVLD